MNKNTNQDYIYRWATSEDIESCAQTMIEAYLGDSDYGEWVRMMMDGRHASTEPDTVAVCQEKSSGRIVAVITTAPQEWVYEGVGIKTLCIVEVGTTPDYQGRGLIRGLMDMISEYAKDNDFDMSFVWGIPGFYRRFGYYQTLGNSVNRIYSRYDILTNTSENNSYLIRPFEMGDIPFAVELHQKSSKNSLVSFPYNADYWKMYAFDYYEENKDSMVVIEKDAKPVGIFTHSADCDGCMEAYMLDIDENISWLDVTPYITEYLIEYGDNLLMSQDEKVNEVSIYAIEGHPIFEILAGGFSKKFPSEQNYYKIIDIKKFITKIKSVFEKRISASYIKGYTNCVSFQLFGCQEILDIDLSNGEIVDVSWRKPEYVEYCLVHMNLEHFMQILFGQQSIDELKIYNREFGSWNNGQGLDNEVRILLNVLFPKKPSYINPCL